MHHKIFHINSRNRIAGTPSNFSYALNFRDVDPDRVVVLHCNIPKSYYLSQSGSNTFTLIENGVDITITIPEGDYTRTSFKYVLTTLLNDATLNSFVYSISVPSSTEPETGKYTFTVSNNGGSQPSFRFVDDSHVHAWLGFDGGSTVSFVADSLISSNVINLHKNDVIYIKSDLARGHCEGVLQEIDTINSPPFTNISFENTSASFYSRSLNSNDSNIYKFQLTNIYGKEVNLNGCNWSMTMVVFKNQHSYELFKTYIKYKMSQK